MNLEFHTTVLSKVETAQMIEDINNPDSDYKVFDKYNRWDIFMVRGRIDSQSFPFVKRAALTNLINECKA